MRQPPATTWLRRSCCIRTPWGVLVPGRDKHFYSSGAFNLIQLIFYILRQTGPAHLLLTTYSISMDSIAAIHRKVETGELLSVRFLIDNRVRSISPKPFDYLVTTFPDCYRCLALHAKVALLYNEDWKITVVAARTPRTTRSWNVESSIPAEIFLILTLKC